MTTIKPSGKAVISCATPETDHLDGHAYLFGHPIAHSLSPLFHQTIYDNLGLKWTQFPLPSTDMDHFLRLVKNTKFKGASVTMPHKVAILDHLDDITPEGRAVGACNTVFYRGNKLVGTNTDTIGVKESFYANVVDPDKTFGNGKPGMVIGGGGAARSAVYALTKFMGCKTVYLVNRDPDEVEAVVSWCKSQGYGDGLMHLSSAPQVSELEGPGAIVACVPNFPPVTDGEKEARRIIEAMLAKPHKGAILEMCYHPTPYTEVGDLAEKAGWQVILGTEAMIYQGLEQDVYWTGKPLSELPVQAVKDVIAKELAKARA